MLKKVLLAFSVLPCVSSLRLWTSSKSVDEPHLSNPQGRLSVLFVKFHKVGGTSMLDELRKETGQSFCCAKACENEEQYSKHGCGGEMGGGCLGHDSRHVALRTWGEIQIQRGVEASMDIWPKQKRYDELLSKGLPHVTRWLSPSSETLLIVTMLREPRERLRSKYYFRRTLGDNGNSCCQDAVANSFDQWLQLLQNGHPSFKVEAVSEYVHFLGNDSVDRAKYVLATRFDHIGLLEDMNGTMVELWRQLGRDSGSGSGSKVEITHARDDSLSKAPWTQDQYAMAADLVAKDMEVYAFAKTLHHARLMKAWGSEAALGEAIQEHVSSKEEAGNHSSC